MAIKDINELKGKFADDKEPNGADFSDFMDSFYHRSSRIPQNNILGLNDELKRLEDTKASKDDLASAKEGLIPMGNALNIADLNTKPKRNNDAYYVLDQLDENGDPYIFRYDTELAEWINTKQVVYKNVAKRTDIGKFRSWLKNKEFAYGVASLAAINRIFDLTIFDSTATPNDVYAINEFYADDTGGVVSIYKNGASFLRISAIDVSKQRYTNDKLDIRFDYTLPATTKLNVTNSDIVISPNCIIVPPVISEADRALIRGKEWLKNKDTDYIINELSAIKRIIDLKIYVTEKNDTDIYTVNIMRTFSTEGVTIGQLSVWKNGSNYITVQLDLSKQHYVRNGQLEVWYDFSLGSADKNSISSEIILSDSAILLFADYYKNIGYEILERYTDEYGNVTSATVRWGDGSSGVYTATDFNTTFLCYDGYQVQHADTYKTLQQPKVIRNGIGVIVNKPKLTVY